MFRMLRQSRPIRISGSTITITESEWNKAGLQGADFVNLFWDAQTQRIGMASTDESDENRFAAKLLRRGVSITARKFFAKFSIDANAQAEGGLDELPDVIAFKVTTASATPPVATPASKQLKAIHTPETPPVSAPKRPSRKTKNTTDA